MKQATYLCTLLRRYTYTFTFSLLTDSLSIEKGYPHWHQEIRMDDNPFQAGLGFTCKLKTSMPFQGRTALEALKGQGLSKKKVCFTLQDKYVFDINPNWHEAGHFYPPCDFGIGFCQLNFVSKISKLFWRLI